MRTPSAPLKLAVLTAAVASLVLVTHPVVRGSGTPTDLQSDPVVGPAHGSVMVVGGGSMGPELYAKFIELAGGPDALIIDVPTAGGAATYPATSGGAWRRAGARNVVVLHTIDRDVANSDSFVAPLKKAGGVWFEGGRQWHLVDRYAGTKTEAEFNAVLARGGVVGGSSAGASILSSFLVRGAREGNEIMVAPAYLKGFGYLRGVGIDQHVVARDRLPDLADSVLPKYPDLLGISEDEGTAWVVRGDTAEIMGRNKAFVYGGKDRNDSGKPFLTLRPGDTYNLATRKVMRRAIEATSLSQAFVDSLFVAYAKPAAGGATVLVAADGKVFVNTSYGIAPQARYMPTTTVPNFPLGDLSDGFNAVVAQLAVRRGQLSLDDPLADSVKTTVRQYLAHQVAVPNGGKLFADLVAKRTPAGGGRGGGRGGGAAANGYTTFVNGLYTPIGAHKTAGTPDGQLQSNVDELYRWHLGLSAPNTFGVDTTSAAATAGVSQIDEALGWRVSTYKGLRRLDEYGNAAGKRHVFVRIPERRATVIILTNDENADVKPIADKLIDRLLFSPRRG